MTTDIRRAIVDDTEWETLITQVADGNDQAFAALYTKAGSFVRRVCLHVLRNPQDADEVANDTFAYVWQHAGRFCATRGSARAWLATIARSRAIDRLRWREARRVRREEPLAEYAGSTPDPEQTAISGDLARRATAALRSLPVAQRETLWLLCSADCSQQETAERLRVPLGTVKTRARLGVRRLRHQLGELVHPPAEGRACLDAH